MTPAPNTPRTAVRIWPMTALIVALALLLMLVDGFNAAMIWFGWQRGSRDGLMLIGVPAALMAYLGLQLLGSLSGSSRDPNPNRTADLTDLFGDQTWLNWCAVALFGLGAIATHRQRRRARHTNRGSAA